MVNFLYFALGLVCMKSLILMLNLIMGLGLKVMIFLNGFSLAYGYSHIMSFDFVQDRDNYSKKKFSG